VKNKSLCGKNGMSTKKTDKKQDLKYEDPKIEDLALDITDYAELMETEKPK